MSHRPMLAEALKRLLPEPYHAVALVAGGFAAAPELANDIDLWVLGVKTDEDVWTFTHDLKTHFEKHSIDGELQEGAADYPEARVTVTPLKPIMKFAHASVEMPPQSIRFGWMPVQMMAVGPSSVDALLETFDLSVHKHAWRLEEPEELLSAVDATWPSDPVMRVARWDTPKSTFQRAQKLHARYGTQLHLADAARLLSIPSVQQMFNGELTTAA